MVGHVVQVAGGWGRWYRWYRWYRWDVRVGAEVWRFLYGRCSGADRGSWRCDRRRDARARCEEWAGAGSQRGMILEIPSPQAELRPHPSQLSYLPPSHVRGASVECPPHHRQRYDRTCRTRGAGGRTQVRPHQAGCSRTLEPTRSTSTWRTTSTTSETARVGLRREVTATAVPMVCPVDIVHTI